MFKKLMDLIGTVRLMGLITNVSMSETYASIDFVNDGTKYMLTLMAVKEEEADAE